MSEYKLSIIVPTYNLENEIDKTFKSIKSQSIGFEKIEVIFVDDNSTDNTLNILNEYAEEYGNITVISTDENSSYGGKPRNIGLKHSTADYVLFLDGDDQLLINACEVLYDKIIYSYADIVIGGQINVFEDGVMEHNPPVLSDKEENFFKNVKNYKLLSMRPAISAKLFKKSLLTNSNVKFPEGIPGEDLIFLLEAVLNSKSIITLTNRYIYYRNLYGTSTTLNLTEKYFYGLINAYLKVSDLLEKYNVPNNIQEVVFHTHLNFLGERAIYVKFFSENDDINLEKIFNSDEFNRLSDKNIFKSNKNFSYYFENMKNGEYNNREVLKAIYNDFDFDSPIITDLEYVKDEISRLNIMPNKIIEDNKYLKKTNIELSKELNQIKSSKSWKIKNKLKFKGK